MVSSVKRADITQIAALENQMFSDAMSERILLDCVENDIFLAVHQQEKIVGYILCSTVLDEMEILRIAVDEDYRRRGYGRLLLLKVREIAQSRGISACFLEVRESNLSAQALYRSVGFSVCGHRSRFYRQPDEDAVLMQTTWSIDK